MPFKLLSFLRTQAMILCRPRPPQVLFHSSHPFCTLLLGPWPLVILEEEPALRARVSWEAKREDWLGICLGVLSTILGGSLWWQ